MSDLETWLRNRNMSTNEFAEIVKCSRHVVWKVKKNLAIDPSLAKKIMEITKSEVIPAMRPKGGAGCEHFHNRNQYIYCDI